MIAVQAVIMLSRQSGYKVLLEVQNSLGDFLGCGCWVYFVLHGSSISSMLEGSGN